MTRTLLFLFLFASTSTFLTASTGRVPYEGLVEDGTEIFWATDGDFITRAQQITYVGLRAGEGYFSADGQRLVFQSERQNDNPFYQIYLLDLATGNTNRVSPGIGKTTCAWIHPTADKVLFASTHLDPLALQKQKDEFERRQSGQPQQYQWDFDESYDLFATNSNGENPENLTNIRGYDAEGSYSPDGSQIVFGSNRNAFTEILTPEEQAIFAKDPSYMMDIFIMNADGSNVRQLTTTRGYDGGPFFSPDGQRLTWRRFSVDGSTAEVYTMKTDGTDVKQITKLGVMSWAPFYHPSGDYLIFATSLQGHANFELYMVDAEGAHAPVRVTMTEGFDGLPVFTPNGKQLAWTTTRAGSSQIFMADWNDAKARQALGLNVTPDLNSTQAAITDDDLKLHVGYLASDALAGRMTGTPGEAAATQYAANAFSHYGIPGFADDGAYFQDFEFNAGVSLGEGNKLEMKDLPKNSGPYEVDKDWRPLAFSQSGEFSDAEIVFAGYGIVAPASAEFPAYNSYENLDVKDRWVLVFRFLPEQLPVPHRQYLNRFADLRYKATVARNLGAKGIIVVSGPNAQVTDQLVPLKLDASSAGMSLAGISITDAVGEDLFRRTETDLKKLQDKLDTGVVTPGFGLIRTFSGNINLALEKRTGRNVLARLRAGRQSQGIIVIGAHIDHLGQDDGGIYHGADDNASGTAAVLELAQAFAAKKAAGEIRLNWDIVFALWSGEELGLLGSAAFTKAFTEENDGALYPKIAAALNFDMVGRLEKNLVMQGAGSSSIWPKLIEKFSLGAGFPIVMQNDPYLPTDSTSFYLQGAPTINAFTGSHDDYHLPSDTADKINYEGTRMVAELMGKILQAVAENPQAPDYLRVENPNQGGGGIRVYLGTIPDYANPDVVGVLLQGVKPGSPAEKAGLQAGDIIVGIAGQNIENIYDYSYILSVLRVGEEVEVSIKRGTETLQLKVTPEAKP